MQRVSVNTSSNIAALNVLISHIESARSRNSDETRCIGLNQSYNHTFSCTGIVTHASPVTQTHTIYVQTIIYVFSIETQSGCGRSLTDFSLINWV